MPCELDGLNGQMVPIIDPADRADHRIDPADHRIDLAEHRIDAGDGIGEGTLQRTGDGDGDV